MQVSHVVVFSVLLSLHQSFSSVIVKNSSSLVTSRFRGWRLCNGSNTCSFGYYCANDSCQCRKAPNGIVDCSNDGLHNFAVLSCYCATFDPGNDHVQVGSCALNCGLSTRNASLGYRNGLYYHFKNVSSGYRMCEPLQRSGALCGRCLPDHYLLAYSYSFACTQCPHVRWNWVRYIMAAYLPLTLFYLVILLCKINVVSSHLHPVVLFSQVMSTPPLARILLLAISNRPWALTGFKVILSFYGIWNLDFFRAFYSDLCLGIGILPTLALDYAIAVYPLLLMVISYFLIVLYDRNYRVITIMWRPFRVLFSLSKKNWDVRTSVIDAFSAFFLLSNVKFLSISFDLLAPTQVYHLYGETYNYTWGVFYAGEIAYFGNEHRPYAVLAIAILFVFVILPVIILALYPFACFQKFLNLFPVHWYVLHTFVDSFQGCYKDGTEPGTRDYRWFSTVYLALRCISFILYATTLDGTYFILNCILLLFILLLLVSLQPYKNRVAHHFRSNSAFLILYALFYAVLIAIDRMTYTNRAYFNFLYLLGFILALVPLLCILGYLLYWVLVRCRCCLWLVHKLHRRHRGYVEVGGDGDVEVDAYCDRVVNPQTYHKSTLSTMVGW